MANKVDKRQEFLQKVGHKLRPDERSDFNVDRWLEAYDQNIEKCAPAVEEYVKNRKALGLDRDEAFVDFYARPDVRHYCALFAQSKLDSNWVNGRDNGIVFVECGPREPAKVARLIRTGQYLQTFFAWLEHMLRLVLQQEQKTSQRSYAVCLFDMSGVSLLQYANPMGPINRLFECRVHLAMAYYAEMLAQVVIVNPPRMVALLFKIMSFLLPTKLIGRFHIAQNIGEIEQWVSADAIPIGFGGQKVFEDNILSNGCIPSRNFGKDDFLKDGMIWEEHSIAAVNYEHVTIGAGHSFVRVLNANGGQKLLYELFANRMFELCVENEKGDYLFPRLRMSTPFLAEEGTIPVGDEATLVRVEVKNLSKIFSLKLRICFQLID